MRRALLAIAAVACAVLAAAPAAAAAKRSVPPRFFGVMWDKQIRDAPDPLRDREWGRMARSGVESARAVFSWYLAESERGVVDHSHTDRIVRDASLHGIELLPVVTYAPPWARADPGELGSAPADHLAYVAYLRLLVDRYGPDGRFWAENPGLPRRPIRTWQIWNEPHVQYQWSPQEDWERRYGALLRASYRAVKQADPGARVVLAGIANASWELLESMYDRGGIRGYFDVMAVHYYERNSHEFVEVSRRVRATLNAHGGRRVPIWWTEAGASASAGRIDSPPNDHFQTTDRGMARHLTRTYKYLVGQRRRFRIQRVYWYTWASSYRRGGGVFDWAGLNRFDGSSVQARPALTAYRRVARRYQGCRKDARARCVR
jgi:polysaccharide biosynthesis protein PslG